MFDFLPVWGPCALQINAAHFFNIISPHSGKFAFNGNLNIILTENTRSAIESMQIAK